MGDAMTLHAHAAAREEIDRDKAARAALLETYDQQKAEERRAREEAADVALATKLELYRSAEQASGEWSERFSQMAGGAAMVESRLRGAG